MNEGVRDGVRGGVRSDVTGGVTAGVTGGVRDGVSDGTSAATASYVHRRGIHCESACQSMILQAQGLEVDEDVVFGLDGSFGFSFFPSAGNAPDIIVGKQAIMPLRAARLMGVEVAVHTPRTGAGLATLLASQVAVMTRVDLGLLPYWNLTGHTSFGGYFVNVIGEGGRAGAQSFEISDAAFSRPVTLAAEALQAARGSRKSPPLNPDWKAYTFGPPRRTPNLQAVGPVAARALCRELLKPGSRSLGVPGLRQLSRTATSWLTSKRGEVEDVDLDGTVVTTSALTRQLLYLGRQIESFGTGGGLFRPMMARFLLRVADAAGEGPYQQAAELFARSGELWSELGASLLDAPAGSSEAQGRQLAELVERVAGTVEQITEHENRALSALKRA